MTDWWDNHAIPRGWGRRKPLWKRLINRLGSVLFGNAKKGGAA